MADAGLWVHIAKVARELGLSQPIVRGMTDRGEIPSERFGGRIYVPAAWLEIHKRRIDQMVEDAS